MECLEGLVFLMVIFIPDPSITPVCLYYTQMLTSGKLRLFTIESSDTESLPGEIDPNQLYVKQDEVQRLIFEERLVLEDDQGEHLDEVTIAVEADEDMLLVYQYSKDESRLLRVQSRINLSLDTDTELRRIQRSDHTRTLRVSLAKDSYRVFVLRVNGREGWRDKIEYEKCASDFVILEGSNIVLLRKLAINRLFGQFRGQTINHEGELCDCAYSVEKGEDDDVIVRRVVTSSTGQEKMTTVLSPSGHIRLHHWSSSDWHLVGGKLRSRTESDVSSVTEARASSELSVVDADIDAYFQKKEELIRIFKMYFQDQPDVQDMIADFLKSLLFEKPQDVVDFADKFFSEFMGIDWTSEEPEDSVTLDPRTTVSENKSYHTDDFNLEPHRALDDVNQSRSSVNFIKNEILNAIIDNI